MTLTQESGVEEVGRRLRAAREGRGLTLTELSFQIRPYLPEQEWVTSEAIRAYEKGTVRRVNYPLLVAITAVLGLSLSDLSPALASEAKTISDLLISSLRCSSPSRRNRTKTALANVA